MPYKDKEKQIIGTRKASLKYYYKNKLSVSEKNKIWRLGLISKIISHYSKGKNCCNCCGETTREFLTVDHINNDGAIQRKAKGFVWGGHQNYRFIIRNNYPPGYQILCYNCNCGRSRRIDKICPHKIK